MRLRLAAALAAASTLLACLPPDTSTWNAREGRPAWSGETGVAIPLSAGLRDFALLQDASEWQQVGLSGGRDVGGSYGVGNGIVFGIIGLDSPWNTLTGAIGPGLQKTDGFFGDSWIDLTDGTDVLELEEEQVQRPRRSAIVRTLSRAGDLTLTTTDLAVVGQPAIARYVTLRNDGEEPIEGGFVIRLAGGWTEDVASGGLLQRRGDREMLVSCPDEGAVDVSRELEPGEELSLLCFQTFRDAPAGEEAPDFAVPTEVPPQMVARSMEETDRWLTGAVAIETPDRRVSDLYEGMLVTLLVQTAPIGVVSPMNRYTSGWLRDSDGTVRLLLRAGMHEQARAVLDALYRVAVVRHSISNSFSLQTDLSGFVEPEDPATFWATADFMPGREPTEAPSYVPLLFWDYVHRTGDGSMLAGGRLEFLEACVRRQERTDDGLLPFSGDETYRLLLSFALGGSPESLGWSAQSSILLAAAADRVVDLGGDPELTELAQAVRDAAESTYWLEPDGFYSPVAWFDGGVHRAPYEDVSTTPLWVGYGSPEDEGQRRNVEAIVELLVQPDGVPVSLAADGEGLVAGHTGMVPGFLLQNVAAVHHDAESTAFDGLGVVATASGHFEEAHRSSDHAPLASIHQSDGLGSDAPARYRPWEGGDAVSGMLDYLVGADWTDGRLTLAPHVPAGWPSLRATGLRLGELRYDLEARAFDEGLIVTLSGDLPTVDVDLTLHGEQPIRVVWINGSRRGVGEASAVLRLDDLQWEGDEPLEVVAVY